MPISVLTDVINMAMKENLVLQFVWPEYELPEEYNRVIKYTNHIDIRPYASSQPAEIIVLERSELQRLPLTDFPHLHNVSIRLTFDEFISATQELTLALHKIDRMNISVEFPEHLQERAVCLYDNTLERLSEQIVKEYKADHPVQLNILTDRLSLSRMNNCNSGTDSLCTAPDGNLYICPGFYYDRSEPVGKVVGGFKIKNPQLYRLEYAPICRICDAYHCRRCVWQNQKSTLETNTPGHEQSVISHSSEVKLKVATVSDEEQSEISRLFKRRKFLETLRTLITESDKELYLRYQSDVTSTVQAIDGWWEEIKLLYHLVPVAGGRWQIDFQTKTIYLITP